MNEHKFEYHADNDPDLAPRPSARAVLAAINPLLRQEHALLEQEDSALADLRRAERAALDANNADVEHARRRHTAIVAQLRAIQSKIITAAKGAK